MAEHAAEDDAQAYMHGEMAIQEQDATYRAFDGLVRYGSLAIAALVLLLVLLFCTKAGFFGAIIPTAILVVAGYVFLNKQPPSIDTL